MARNVDETNRSPVSDALGMATGAALVLDDELRILLATEEASLLLGFDVPLGTSAPALLCGKGPKRPVAEALVEGRPIEALIPRPRSAGGTAQHLRVRSLPLRRGSRRTGWLLLLADATGDLGEGPVRFHGMWTQDARMKEMFRVLERVAGGSVTVLVRGETGTGKELVARALHELSPRRAGPFRALNCAALPPHLLESELFGHTKGAFTGAVRDVPGHIQLAHRGTLFLDEVAELPLDLQAKLLRVLEARSVVPVGGREAIPVDVRIVSATHRALRQEVEAGRFRADLMFRLRVIPIFLPPLRERRGDVALLCDRLMEDLNRAHPRRVERLSPAALAVLERHDWPGNVRELRNVLEYAWAIGEGPVLQPHDLPPELVEPALAPGGVATGEPRARPFHPDPEGQRIVEALERMSGNRERAAKLLGVSRVTLWRRMKELRIAPDETS